MTNQTFEDLASHTELYNPPWVNLWHRSCRSFRDTDGKGPGSVVLERRTDLHL